MKCLIPALLGLSLASCSPITAFEKGTVEPLVDKGVTETVSRLCKLPPDIVLRQVASHGDNVLEALFLLCPDYRDLMLRGFEVISTRNALGLSLPPVQIPSEPILPVEVE